MLLKFDFRGISATTSTRVPLEIGMTSARRFLTRTNLRHSVVVEAARLLYKREFKEYYQAKREAARRLGCTILPTNQEIHHHLLLIAEATEGSQRTERLQAMRCAALEMMESLESFRPRLIGSVLTGHIRAGSDIDLHLYSDDLDAVLQVLEPLGLEPEVRRVRAGRDGQEREFLHIGLRHGSGFEVEMTLYQEQEYQEHPVCSITGGPMARVRSKELRTLLKENVPSVEPTRTASSGGLQECLFPQLDTERFLSLSPELQACVSVEQNHEHHTDVYHHTLEVVDQLFEMRNTGFEILGDRAPAVVEHLHRPGPGGWNRFTFVVLAALCHDFGKPECKEVQDGGRIKFPGHERLGANKARSFAECMNLPSELAEALEKMVLLHRSAVRLPCQVPRSSELYLLFRDLGTLLPELLLLSIADVASTRGPAQPSYRYEEQVCFCTEMLEEYFSSGFLRYPNLPVSATDLQTELGLTDPGLVKRLISSLMVAYVDEEFQGREDGLAWAADFLNCPAELW